MRRRILDLATITTFLAALYSVAKGLSLLLVDLSWLGLFVLGLVSPGIFALCVVFEWVARQMDQDKQDSGSIIDVKPQEVRSKFGDG